MYSQQWKPQDDSAHLTAGQEREDFAHQINRQLGIPAPRADDWNTLLWSLADRTRTGPYLIVLDEINWLGSKDPTFLDFRKTH
jgi:hypothetical protein